MKKASLKLMDMVKVLLSGLVTMLGFTTCEDIEEPDEYGSPYSDFIVDGMVTDEGGNPISNIRVTVEKHYGYSTEKLDSMIRAGENPYPDDEVRTDKDGHFVYKTESGGFYTERNIWLVDDDGAQNGGEFEITRMTIDDSDSKQTKKGKNWYSGEYTYTLEATMKKKN